jgi:hypothetical protein
MKGTYCLFLPADLAVVEQFVQQMFKAGACFDRDYRAEQEGNLVRVSTESQEQFNVIRRTIAKILMKELQ